MAEKPEAHRIQYNALFMSHIFWLPDEISEEFQRSQKGFCQPIFKEHNQCNPNIRRHRKYKMTAAKPEVVISHVLQQIDTRFERLNLGFLGRPTRRTHRRHSPTSTDTVKARWRPPTGSSNILRSTTDRHVVRKAIPRFSESPDLIDSSSTPADIDRHRKRKMATVKSEAVIYHVLQQIHT
jgi:hypothetical protein